MTTPAMSYIERREMVLRVSLIEGDLREEALNTAWFDKYVGDWCEGTPLEVIEAAEAIFDMADDLSDFAQSIDPCRI